MLLPGGSRFEKNNIFDNIIFYTEMSYWLLYRSRSAVLVQSKSKKRANTTA